MLGFSLLIRDTKTKMNPDTMTMPVQNNKDDQEKQPAEASGDMALFEADILSARLCALDILDKVLNKRQILDQTLEVNEGFLKLGGRDRSFVRMLVSTTLRRLGQIDDLIARAQERPDSLKSTALRNILRLGVCQIFFTEVPDHAAVDTSVRLASHIGMERQKAFVNGLLRNLIRSGKEVIGKQDAPRLNAPEWLLKIWIADYGMREAAQIAQANMNEAPLDITVKGSEAVTLAEWREKLDAKQLATGSLRLREGGNVRDLAGFDKGEWWVQDAASALPARLFGPIKDQDVLDICAAPGGKTMQLAAQGARVTAIDRSAQRLKRLEENMKRMGLQDHVSVIAADAVVWSPEDGRLLQRILLDAPCSATGTIRRHPDLPHLKTPRDLDGLTAIQNRLLEQAGKLLDVGGILIYCTCSLQKDEGERQINAFLARYGHFRRVPIAPEEVGGYAELISEDGDLRCLPHHLEAEGGVDGFYAARLTRIG